MHMDSGRFESEISVIKKKLEAINESIIALTISNKWVKALAGILIPLLISAVVVGIMMYTTQNDFARFMDTHSNDHNQLDPIVRNSSEELIAFATKANRLKEDVAELKIRLKEIERRVDNIYTHNRNDFRVKERRIKR